MKKLLVVILICALASLLFVGCFSVAPDEPDPGPILVMSIDVDVVGWNESCIMYTIENDGDFDVYYYELAFNVTFGKGHKPIVLYADSLGLFEVGAELTTCVDIICPFAITPAVCPYYGAYDVNSVEVEVLDLW